ncbi:MAG: 16S rRNA (guanine(966)-N(2))-methyltransferase RsmD, partial [Sciscionella sp.]|nr:16S rRNA (guanine(966)-N(2))-methyltransferase RsmD [Sciscionella sp.]
SERVREALFSALDAAGAIDGARVLDLYAGSGALGLEALSRGAVHACFVESDSNAVKALRHNVSSIAGDSNATTSVIARKVESALGERADEPFDLVLADPPYAVDDATLAGVLTALVTGGWLALDSLVVIERATRSAAPRWPVGLTPLRERSYGDTCLHWAEHRPFERDQPHDTR